MKHQGDRNTAWAVLAACDTARPRSLVVENVVDFGRWQLFEAWRGTLRAMGYDLRTHVLNASDFELPQSRARLIITGTLDGEAVEVKGTGRSTSGLGACLDPDESSEHRWAAIDSKPERTRARIRTAQGQAGARCFWNNVSESTARSLADPFPTITTQSGSQFYLIDGDRCRILNPRELARGQGFGDHYRLPSQRGLAGKLIGNAIPPTMAEAVVRQVAEAM